MAIDYDWDDIGDDYSNSRNTKPLKINNATHKLVDIKCPACGGQVQVNPLMKKAYCPYCGNQYDVQEAIARVKVSFDNAKQFGHEFENGRIRAQRTNREIILGTYRSKPQSSVLVIALVTIGFALCFINIIVGIMLGIIAIIIETSKPKPIFITMSNERIIVKSRQYGTVNIPLNRISDVFVSGKGLTFQTADRQYTYMNIENAEKLREDFYRYMEG